MKKNLSRGFTLIELLVVIAIIGILASVVLASLNSARNKGADAAIKASLTNARAQAELFYDAGTTYEGVCAVGATSIGSMVLGAATKLSGTTTVGGDADAFTYSAGGATNGTAAVCHDSPAGWAAIVSLKSPSAANPSSGWCVDSTGAAKESTTLAANIIVCP